MTLNLLSYNYNVNFILHCLDFPFEGQRFESAKFRKFIRDFLENDDRYDTSYYCHYMVVIYGLSNGIVTYDFGSL